MSSRDVAVLERPVEVDIPRAVAPVTNGADALSLALRDLGVDAVFGCVGETVSPLYRAMEHRTGVRIVLFGNELAAVHAAQGYARSTGKAGVAVVPSGPGTSNATTGLLNAMCDSVPLVCICGQVETALIGTDAFQECDALGISRSVTKWSARALRVDALPSLMRKAFAVATGMRPGPVLIEFPRDVQLRPAPRHLTFRLPDRPSRIFSHRPSSRAGLRRMVEIIRDARRPIYIAGGGLINSGVGACAAFTELLRRTAGPCVSTLMGLGAFPTSNAQHLGMLGTHGTTEANLAARHADVVVCVGTRLVENAVDRAAAFCPESALVHIDIDAVAVNKFIKADAAIVGDCATVLAEMLQCLPPGSVDSQRLDPWWSQIDAWRAQHSFELRERADRIAPRSLLRRLQSALDGRDPIVAADIGPQQILAARFLRFDVPRGWLTSGGAGASGYGLPAALGAQVAHPARTVVCVTDGTAILTHMQEMLTASRQRLPVKIVLMNFRGAEVPTRAGTPTQISDCGQGVDFGAIARAFGWRAGRVEQPGALDGALAECLDSPGPYLLEALVESERDESGNGQTVHG
jgi:acetolactate synthase-1/2/3 large subunit